jgi:hypothetical protein
MDKQIVGYGQLADGRCPFCDTKDRTLRLEAVPPVGPVITCTVCWCSIEVAMVVNWAERGVNADSTGV